MRRHPIYCIYLVVLVLTSCKTRDVILPQPVLTEYEITGFCDLSSMKNERVYIRGVYSGVEEYWQISSIGSSCDSIQVNLQLPEEIQSYKKWRKILSPVLFQRSPVVTLTWDGRVIIILISVNFIKLGPYSMLKMITLNALLPTALLCALSLSVTAQELDKVNHKINRNCYTIKESYSTLKSKPEIKQGAYLSDISGLQQSGQYLQGQRSGIWTSTQRGKIVQKYDFDLHKELVGQQSQLVQRIFIKDPDDDSIQELPLQSIYLGGDAKMLEVFVKCVRYPAEAAEKRITGKVKIHFLLGADGRSKVELPISNLGGNLEAEALRVFRLLPQDWLPVYIDGKPVDTEVEIQFGFSLS